MTLDQYNSFCRGLPHASHVVQWGGAHVWKVGGKVFAIAGWSDDERRPFVTFKCSPVSYDLLKERPGCRPAPYLASRGLRWIQRMDARTLDDQALRDYIAASHRLVAAGLPKRAQRELGLTPAPLLSPSTDLPSPPKRAARKPASHNAPRRTP